MLHGNNWRQKNKEVQYVDSCPTFLTLKKIYKLEEILRIIILDKDVIDVSKFEKLHNSQVG